MTRTPVLTLVRYLWASPATALGVAMALVARACGASGVIVNGVLEVGGGRLGQAITRLPRPFAFCAITFGHVVIGVDARSLAQFRAHERVHVEQYERWGILFFPLYIASSLWQALRGRRAYWDNHFEREARGELSMPRRALR